MLIPGGRRLHALDAGQPSAAHLLHMLWLRLGPCLLGCILWEGLFAAVQQQRRCAHAQDVSELQPLLRTFPALRKRMSSVVDAGCALCSPVPCRSVLPALLDAACLSCRSCSLGCFDNMLTYGRPLQK